MDDKPITCVGAVGRGDGEGDGSTTSTMLRSNSSPVEVVGLLEHLWTSAAIILSPGSSTPIARLVVKTVVRREAAMHDTASEDAVMVPVVFMFTLAI